MLDQKTSQINLNRSPAPETACSLRFQSSSWLYFHKPIHPLLFCNFLDPSPFSPFSIKFYFFCKSDHVLHPVHYKVYNLHPLPMATLFATSSCSSFIHNKSASYLSSSLSKIPFGQNFPFSLSSNSTPKDSIFLSKLRKMMKKRIPIKKYLSVEGELSRESEAKSEESENQQEVDWKLDAGSKKFTGNPSIEAAIKLEKKRADRKLKELDREHSNNPIVGILNSIVCDNLSVEKER